MPATAYTGKSLTFTYGGTAYTDQLTAADPSTSTSQTTTQTFGSAYTSSDGAVESFSIAFLSDADVAGGGLYDALRDAAIADSAGAIVISITGGAQWTGNAKVQNVDLTQNADGTATATAELVAETGTFTFTPA